MSHNCADVHSYARSLPRLRFPFSVNGIPHNGLYLLFEDGEWSHGGDRIVRVGTHTGNNQLKSRLHQHFVNENKDRSIFRKNIGRAMLARDTDSYAGEWEIDRTTKLARQRFGPADISKQGPIERAVSDYLQEHMSFVVIWIDDAADRLRFESRLISTLSLCDDCQPSTDWLGHHSPKDAIRNSGLWLVNELYKTPLDKDDLRALLDN
jgi:hypothetical protein